MITGERSRPAASEYLAQKWGLQYTPATLANMAAKGTGPVYRLRGRYARYRDQDLDAWARPRISGLRSKASDPIDETRAA
jgi:hypothetical protein